MKFIIYRIRQRQSGKSYVGQTCHSFENRIRGHFATASPIGFALRKYSRELFTFKIIEKMNTKKQADMRERFWIRSLDCRVPRGYNLTAGGEGNLGWNPSEETRKRMGAANVGRHHSAETKALWSTQRTGKKRPAIARARRGKPSNNLGKPMKEETRRKMSLMNSGANNPNYGNHLSKAARERISLAQKERYWSPEERWRWSLLTSGASNGNYGKHFTLEAKAKISASVKRSFELRRKAGLQIGRPKGIPQSPEERAARSVISKVAWARRKQLGTDHWYAKAAA